MQKLTILLIIAFLSCKTTSNKSVNNKMPISSKAEVTEELDWILGSWVRTNNNEGQTTYENWKKVKPNTWKGHGYTLAGQDTVFQEHMYIHTTPRYKVLTVAMPDNSRTTFPFITDTNKAFSCENLENDFPKRIKYWIDNDTLKAEISGGGPTIPFSFVKR